MSHKNVTGDTAPRVGLGAFRDFRVPLQDVHRAVGASEGATTA